VKISLCLIVWNELEGCKKDVPSLPREEFDEIYAVDGGSADGTVEYLKSQGIAVYRQPKPGLNAAYVYAVEKSKCDAIVVFFPKATIDPKCVLDIWHELQSGCELVIASRNIRGGRNEEDQKVLRLRKWGVMTLAMVAALIWRKEGFWIRDVLHGVKGFTVEAFKRMGISDEGLTIDLEMTIRSYRHRMSRIEIPVQEKHRMAGTTHFRIIPTAKKLGKFMLCELTRSR
jgi:glycosyltransferase involved in cell wall biosynthesis